jgi:hypothetical protein
MRTFWIAVVFAMVLQSLFGNDNALAFSQRSAAALATVASFPFSDDFETGIFDPNNWSTKPTNNGIAEVNSNYPHSGAKSAFLGQKLAGYASESLILDPHLSGQSDVFLDFWVRAIGDDNYRWVSISNDGGANWTVLRDLSSTSQSFGHEVLDISSAAKTHFAIDTLSSTFRILFAYSQIQGHANDGLIIDDLRLTQRAQELAPFPLAQDSFETGSFQQGLYPQSTLNGVTEINSKYPHSGSQSVFLGQHAVGYASASLILALDLSNQTDVLLDFWVRAIGDDNYRWVSISDDGGANWTVIHDMRSTSQSFSHKTLDIASVAASNHMELNSNFRILFAYSQIQGHANDGLIIDDIRLGSTNPNTGLVYIPFVKR